MKRMRIYFFLRVLFFFWPTGLFAQGTNRVTESLLSVLNTAKEDTVRVKTLNLLSRQYLIDNKNEEGMKYANQAMDLANKLFNAGVKEKAEIRQVGRREIAYAHFYRAAVHNNKNDYPEALKNLFAALKIFEEIEDKNGHAKCYNLNGMIYTGQGNYPDAIKCFRASLKIYEELGDKQAMFNIYNNIGTVYKKQGNVLEALKNALTSLKISEEIGNKEGLSSSHINIGNIYVAQENYTEALKNYSAALRISEERGNKASMARIYGNIGYVYLQQNNYPEALKNKLASLKIAEEIGDKHVIAGSNQSIGIINKEQNNYSEAFKNFLTALKINEEIGDKNGIAQNQINMGELLLKQAAAENTPAARLKYDEAIQYLNKGILLSREIDNKENVREAFWGLAEIYEAKNDFKKALEYTRLYVELKDSLMNNETAQKLEQQRTKYEVEKAVSGEKAQNDKILADEKLAGEKKLAEEKTRHELQTAEDKFQFELALANERTEQEKIKAGEQLRKEQALAEERYRSGQVLADIRMQQENEKTAIKRKNEFWLIGAGLLMFALVFLFLYLRQTQLRQRAIEKAESAHKMAELELQSLRAQLNPHFMFNSLNAIQELILMEDNERSHVYLSRFSKLIRMLLDNASQPFIPLKKEIDFLELYLSLEKLRIPDLKYSIETEPGMDTGKVIMPNMMLQPYIENAIWHGLSPKQGEKNLKVKIHSQNGSVEYDIEDNGIGRKKAAEMKSLYRKEHKSKGMELLTKRFKLLSEEYGSEIKTTISDIVTDGIPGGTKVSVSIPRRFGQS